MIYSGASYIYISVRFRHCSFRLTGQFPEPQSVERATGEASRFYIVWTNELTKDTLFYNIGC